MANVLVVNHVTLDGVMQAPARPDEDTRDGFARGGWAMARNDELMAAKIGERMAGERAFLFGRRTYEDFYAVWPKRAGNPFSEALTATTKYVARAHWPSRCRGRTRSCCPVTPPSTWPTSSSSETA